MISHFKPTHLESAWQPRVLEGFVFFSVYNQQNGCQYKIIKTITATWELINRCTQRWLVWWTNYRDLLLLNPANKPDHTCIMPTYPSALCWVIWFRFMTIALRWGWFRLHLAQFWKKKKPAFTNSHSHRRAFQGQRTHSAFIIQRHAAETSVSFHFQLEKQWPPILTWTIWFSLKCLETSSRACGSFPPICLKPNVSVLSADSVLPISSGVCSRCDRHRGHHQLSVS